MAKKITDNMDVCAWAKEIVAAKGEKFTPLSKGEQYVIAQCILSLINDNAEKPSVENLDGQTPAPEAESELTDGWPGKSEATEYTPADYGTGKANETNEGATEDTLPTPPQDPVPTPTATMTRGYAYHRAGFDAQQTFDKFLEWGKTHPKEMSVMDFATGSKSSDAAFAYWLHEIISVDVPQGV